MINLRPEIFLKSVLQRKFTSLHLNLCILYLTATISFIMKSLQNRMESGNLITNAVMKNPLLRITYDRPNSFFEEINQNTFLIIKVITH